MVGRTQQAVAIQPLAALDQSRILLEKRGNARKNLNDSGVTGA